MFHRIHPPGEFGMGLNFIILQPFFRLDKGCIDTSLLPFFRTGKFLWILPKKGNACQTKPRNGHPAVTFSLPLRLY
jgi:hypothetical protein